MFPAGRFHFKLGSVEQLEEIEDASIDCLILSNILDNLYPDDSAAVIRQSARIIKCGGKLLVKLNAYLTQKQIEDWDIRFISGNLFDDGLLLLNRTSEEWKEIFGKYFSLESEEDIYYPEYGQTNRLMLLKKREI